MNVLSDCHDILNHYPGEFRPEHVELLGSAGGFSGARIWRIRTPDRTLCLKGSPADSSSEENLGFIHSVLLYVSRAGLDIVPVPCQDRLGRTFVRLHDQLWELAPWMPGRADFWQNPLGSKLEAAMQTLAEFHRAAATYPNHAPRFGRSPGIHQRLEKTRRYTPGDLDELFRCIVPEMWPDFYERAREAVTGAPNDLGLLEILLKTASAWEVPLQICIRDVWHDHVLFSGEHVTGLVDFDAMGTESVAADVARLLGSMTEIVPGAFSPGPQAPGSQALLGNPFSRSSASRLGTQSFPEGRCEAAELGNESDGGLRAKTIRDTFLDAGTFWQAGLAAYESIHPLQDREKALVEVFDRSGVVLGAMNWIEWLFRERREFHDPAAVARRFDQVLKRLDSLRRDAHWWAQSLMTSGLWTGVDSA